MQWINRVLTKTAIFAHHEAPQKTDATIEVLNNQIVGFSIAQIKSILKRNIDIKCILHSKEHYLEAVSDNTQLRKNDLIIVSAFDYDLDAIGALLGQLQGKQS